MVSGTVAPPLSSRAAVADEQRIDLGWRDWNAYLAFSDVIGQRSNLKVIYTPGHLILMTKSRLHEWLAERTGELVKAVANHQGLDWETAGQTTFRLERSGAGLEGDCTFYFGANALRMKGPKNVDLAADPPPDLAIEIEVSHSADDAMLAWGRLGTPEVWRFDASTWACSFWDRLEDGTFQEVPRSQFLDGITGEDVASQLRVAFDLGAGTWFGRLQDWVRDVIAPRPGEGA